MLALWVPCRLQPSPAKGSDNIVSRLRLIIPLLPTRLWPGICLSSALIIFCQSVSSPDFWNNPPWSQSPASLCPALLPALWLGGLSPFALRPLILFSQ